jgi:hypothetical protein
MRKLQNKIRLLKNQLESEVKAATRAALLFSAGKDSVLLLHLMAGLEFDLIAFPHLWNSRQRLAVLNQLSDRPLFFYSPTAVDFASPYAKITYMIGGHPFRVCMEHKPSTRCGLEIGQRAIAEAAIQPYYYWDVTLTGTKALDEIMDQPFRFEDLCSESHRFLTPLWDWTDSEVIEALVSEGIDYVDTDTGTFEACMACVETPTTEEVYCPKRETMTQGLRGGHNETMVGH